MNILVLGGDGFIGSYFADKAVSLGHKVTVFDRFPYNVSKNLESQRGKVRFINGEFANRKQLAAALQNQTVVYHFICATTPVTSWQDPFIEIETNLRSSIQLGELAAIAGVKKIVFSSSGGTIYGRQKTVIKENTLPCPFNPYGIAKLATEHFLNYFREHRGVAVDIYRVGNAYGPRQPMDSPQGVIAVWMGRILNNDKIEVYGDANTVRDYVYVEDIAHLFTHSLNDIESSDIYNLGSGQGVSVLKLLEVFRTVIDKPFKYKIFSRRKCDNTSVILDSSKLLSFFPGFKFQKIEDKIRDTWLYVKEQHSNKKPLKSAKRVMTSLTRSPMPVKGF
ncbi:MAG: NAD-dependent epimerase/dehydratase family protein [Sedimentisphaerales bacterium]